MTLLELRAQQQRRARLLNLTLFCTVTLAVVALAACGPADVDIARSGVPVTQPKVVAMTAVPAERLVLPTTTTHLHPTSTVPLLDAVDPPAPRDVTPVVPATTPPVPASGDCGGWEGLVSSYFPGEVATACRIIMCESQGNPSAVSATGDHGLAQVNEATWNKPGHHDPVADWIGRNWGSVYDPATNLEMARRIKAAYGWGMWSCA